MVSAVSNFSSVTRSWSDPVQQGPGNDDAAPRNGGETTVPEAGTGSDPIVQISLSDDALRHLASQPPSLVDQTAYLSAHSAAVANQAGITLKDGENLDDAYAQYFDDINASIEMRKQIAELNGVIRPHLAAQDTLDSRQADYNRILKTKPVPKQEVTGTNKDAAYDLLDSLGYTRPGENQTVSFSSGGLTYTFKGDGSIWTNEIGVPTSESAKQLVLNTLSGLISYGRQDISTSLSKRDALQSQYDAIQAKYAPKSSS